MNSHSSKPSSSIPAKSDANALAAADVSTCDDEDGPRGRDARGSGGEGKSRC